MSWLKRLLGGQERTTRVTTIAHPLVIRGPRLRFLNLLGPAATKELAADKEALGQLFRDSREVQSAEACDVLILYCKVDDDGRALKEIVRASQAPIVIVASENDGNAYVRASATKPHEHTNLVMTIDRRGKAFENFFGALFRKMFSGTTMPVAWVELAPQIPNAEHLGAPETIFACGAGQVRFEPA